MKKKMKKRERLEKKTKDNMKKKCMRKREEEIKEHWERKNQRRK